MMIITAAISLVVLVLLTPEPALAWGPVTHVAQGMQVLATVVTPAHPLESLLAAFPEVFLYGSLAPDIVQGRRFQSRLRRHSHNWATGLGLLSKAGNGQERAFAFGYLAHLGGDVVAHNFFLPARMIGRYRARFSGHIYHEARFDSIYESDYRELLLKLLEADFGPLDAMLDRAVDSPLVPFATHRRIFEGGLRRIRQLHRVITALGGPAEVDWQEADLFSTASCGAIADILERRQDAHACRFDPMGRQALRIAQATRRNLQRLTKLGPAARKSAHELASGMLEELRAHLSQSAFCAGGGQGAGGSS